MGEDKMKVNLSEVWVGEKFKHNNKIYVKANHSRGWYLNEHNRKTFHKFKKHAKVEKVK